MAVPAFGPWVRAQSTLGCASGGAGGAFPTSGTGGGGVYPSTLPPFALAATLNVTTIPPGASCVTKVVLVGLDHSFASDCMFVLEDPAGAKHLLFNQVGGACEFQGECEIVPLGGPPLPACVGGSFPSPAAFAQQFGSWPSGTNSIANDDLLSVAPQIGAWKLHLFDWSAGDAGTLASWELCFGTPPSPPPPQPVPCLGSELATLYAADNAGSNGGVVYFDANVASPAGIRVSQIDVNTDDGLGAFYTLDVYTIPGTFSGNELAPQLWTHVSSGFGYVQGHDLASVTEVDDFTLPAGSWGLALVLSGNVGFSYTNGNGSNQSYANAELSLSLGAAQNSPWSSPVLSPRVFNGSLRYDCYAPPLVYCTSGTSAGGCTASISVTASPSASFASPAAIFVSGVDGGRAGIVFYGIDNSSFTPLAWAVGSTSFLCVKPPTQRMSVLSTGGTVGACDGAFAQDWNAFHAANPSALGSPFVAGQLVFAQAWYRDPPAPKTTNLSNAIELELRP